MDDLRLVSGDEARLPDHFAEHGRRLTGNPLLLLKLGESERAARERVIDWQRNKQFFAEQMMPLEAARSGCWHVVIRLGDQDIEFAAAQQLDPFFGEYLADGWFDGRVPL